MWKMIKVEELIRNEVTIHQWAQRTNRGGLLARNRLTGTDFLFDITNPVDRQNSSLDIAMENEEKGQSATVFVKPYFTGFQCT